MSLADASGNYCNVSTSNDVCTNSHIALKQWEIRHCANVKTVQGYDLLQVDVDGKPWPLDDQGRPIVKS